MGEDSFKLPGSSYAELVKVIQAYHALKGPGGIQEVGKHGALHPTVVSRNNGFLAGTGIIEGGNNKVLTTLGSSLAMALTYENEQEIEKYWEKVVQESEFIEKILSAIKIRKGMEASVLQTHIAYSAGQKKSKNVLTGASTIIEILKTARMIEEVDGKLTIISSPEKDSHIEIGQTEKIPLITDQKLNTIPKISIEKQADSPSVTIQIQIRCTPQDIQFLGESIRKLMKDLRSDDTSEDTDLDQ